MPLVLTLDVNRGVRIADEQGRVLGWIRVRDVRYGRRPQVALEFDLPREIEILREELLRGPAPRQ